LIVAKKKTTLPNSCIYSLRLALISLKDSTPLTPTIRQVRLHAGSLHDHRIQLQTPSFSQSICRETKRKKEVLNMLTTIVSRRSIVPAMVLAAFGGSTVAAQLMAKPQVANLISKVENGVDEFRKYLERRGESARNTASTPQAQARGGKRGQATDAQKGNATAKKDDLDDALGELNRSTNRLRRKFDATDTWMQTKVEVERVVDDGRRVNQAVTKGKYGSDAARLWAGLRTGINDLARAYGVTPLGV
jgi:hypothetical protein